MARNGSSMSGANNTPLGQRTSTGSFLPVASSSSSSLLKPSYLQQIGEMEDPPSPGDESENGISESDRKRIASEAVEAARAAAVAAAAKVERKRKRKSRWAGETSDKTFIPGMPTMLPHGLSKDQEEAYLLQLKIEDTSRRLRSGDLGIPPNPEDRSPSPEPIYSTDGKRLNTREYRKRRELENIRHEAITRILEINTDYKPPPDYKPPQVKVNDKVMIPQDDHPDINFVGLLIGPRGNTLKSMERETGAKIIIRGKGSVKEGKVGRKDGQPLPGEDEPLHAYVTATDPEAVKKAVNKIKEIIRQGVDVPEGQNDLRKNQLRELALLNGTLREGDGIRCTNCGALDHKSWQCQDKPNITNSVVCTSCGSVGHVSKDCAQKRPGMGDFENPAPNKMDDEYMSLMAELGEGPPPASQENKTYQEGRITWGPARTYQARPPRPLMGGPPRPPMPPIPPSVEYGGAPTNSNYGYGAAPGTTAGQTPPGQGSESWSNSKPPSLMQQNVPPPWQQAGGTPPRWVSPPAPPGTVAPSQSGAPGAPPPRNPPPPGMQPPPPSWGSEGPHYMPPPNFLAAPPPPPPPSTTGNSTSSAGPPPPSQQGPPGTWNMPPWGGPPPPPPPPPGAPSMHPPGQGPVPPPPPPGTSARASGNSQPPSYWPPHSGWQGVPPPGQSSNANLMSNLMAAPPPPPPPN